METWFKVERKAWRVKGCITPVDVIKETAQTLTIAGRYRDERHAKVSEWHAYYPTLEEAVAEMCQICERNIQHAEAKITLAEEIIDHADGLLAALQE